ncbi:MAG: flagellar export chaperone FliS [Candidatus Sumerlaeia bacterium]|nr:flagellar export chaperone FliS [Candidatus Sumerlaeia bacterium]
MAASGYNAYQRTQIATADRRKIIVLLYEGAISRLSQAAQALDEGDGDRRAYNVNKALDIIHFLTTSLDFERGGAISPRLEQLYAYIRDIVTLGSIEGRREKLEEAMRLLGTLLDAWRAISSSGQSTSALEESTREMAASLAVAG